MFGEQRAHASHSTSLQMSSRANGDKLHHRGQSHSGPATSGKPKTKAFSQNAGGKRFIRLIGRARSRPQGTGTSRSERGQGVGRP